MGYNTDFEGSLKFTTPLSKKALNKLELFMGQDCRENNHWINSSGLTWINLEISEGNTGIEWNGDEKSYDMCEKVNMIIDNMILNFPEFGLSGSMKAQGERMDDRWTLKMIDGRAVKVTLEDEVEFNLKQAFIAGCEAMSLGRADSYNIDYEELYNEWINNR